MHTPSDDLDALRLGLLRDAVTAPVRTRTAEGRTKMSLRRARLLGSDYIERNGIEVEGRMDSDYEFRGAGDLEVRAL